MFKRTLLATTSFMISMVSVAADLPQNDQAFVAKAGPSNAAEVAASKLALKNGHDSKVKSFATMMIADHTKAGKELKVAAAKSKTAVPQRLDAEQQGELDKLKTLKGADFDQEYVGFQLKAHQDAVALFTQEASTGGDESIKAFATKTLPTLEEHLVHVQKLAGTK